MISRTAMIEALGYFNDRVNGDPHFLNGIETAKEIAENLPAVDAIPVEWLNWRVKNAKYNKIVEAADAFEFVQKCWKEQEEQDG